MIENLFTFVRTLGNQRIEGKKFFTTQIGVLGTLSDGTGAVGTAGKVLSSTGTGVEWVTVGSSNVADLDDLTDVVITTASTGQLLRFNGTSWVNWTPNFLTAYGSLNDLSDAVIATPTTGQLLRYNGTNWVNWTHNFLTTSANLNDLANVSVAGPTNGQILRYNAGTGLWIADDEGEAQIPTLEQVTTAGNTTTNGISAASFTATGFISGGNITGTKVTTPTVEFNGAISTNSVYQVDQGEPNPNVFYAKWNGDVQFTVNGDGYAIARTGYKVTGATGGFLKADGTIDTSTYLTSYTETQTLDAVTDLGNTTTNTITVGGVTVSAGGSVTAPVIYSPTLWAVNGPIRIMADESGSLIPDQGDPANPVIHFEWMENPLGHIDTDGKVTFNGFKTPSGTSSGFLKADGSIDTNTYLTSVAPYALDDLTDVSVDNPQDGDFLKYDDITGEWISAAIPTPTLDSVTTAGNTTANTIDVGGVTTPYVQFKEVVTPLESHRSVNWGEDHNSLEVYYTDEKHFDVGQDQMWYVKNRTEDTLAKGTVVMAAGAVGNSGKIAVAPLVADGTVSGRYAVGILMDDVRADEFGFAMTQGTIRGINTGEFAEGDTLYPDPLQPGALTNIEPASPALKLPIAFVVTSAQNGAIAVRMAQGLDLHEVHDVQITDGANGQLLQLQSGVWTNWTPDYLTAETDPVFTASAAATISTTNISNWNSAYGWGDHALAGYLTTYENNYISDVRISEFIVTFTGEGNAFNGDVDFSALPFAPVTHNHAIAEITGLETALDGKQPVGNYITTESDPTVPDHVKAITEQNIVDWNKAYDWGNHADYGYLTSFTETDPTVPAHVKSITATEKSNWNTAYGWGNHSGLYVPRTWNFLESNNHGYCAYDGVCGWRKIAKVTLNGNCQSLKLWGFYRDLGYTDTGRYDIEIAARAECDFLANNDSHNIYATIVASTSHTSNITDKIRVVLVGSSDNRRDYEVQFYREAWDNGYWQLQHEGGWDVWSDHQAPGEDLGVGNVHYTSKVLANEFYMAGNLVATRSWVTSQNYLTTYENNYISDVRLAETTLSFSGEGSGFTGDIDLSLLPFAASSHTHVIADVTGLQTALNEKVPTSRTITINGTALDLSADRSWTIDSADGYISNVKLLETTLTFEGEGNAFTGDIDLSGLPFQPAGSYLTAEADTLATVTGRGNSTPTSLYLTGGSGEVPALHIRSGGSSWSEGLAIHPSTDSGYGLTFYRTRAAYTDQTNTWAIGNLGDSNALNHFGLLRRGLTGGIADRAADAIFTVNPTGTFKFGFNPYVGTNAIWHAGNDGSGSGLDADLLDGNHASAFATRQDGARYSTDFNSILSSGFFNAEAQPANAPDDYGQLIVAKGIDTGLQIFGGYDSNNLWFRGWGYGPEANGFYPWRKVWHDGNDGSGSGLDADLLDGQQGSYYQPASTAITTSNIASQSVLYATSSGNSVSTDQTNFSALFIEDSPVATKEYVTSQGYITGYTETDPIYVSERDSLQLNKTVHPTLLFSTLADYNKPSGYSTMIQPSSYQNPLPSHGYYHIIARRDTGGGYGALLQSYNSHELYHGNTTESTTNISWYKIWNSGDFTSTSITNWNTAYGWGNNYISDVRLQETNLEFTGQGSAFSGTIDLSGLPFQPAGSYLTSESDTLATVTARGASTSTPIIVTASEGREVAVYMPSSYTTDDLVSGHEYGWYSDHWRLGMTRSGGAAGADFVVQWNGARRLSLSQGGNLTATGVIYATGGNSTNWNAAYGWGNHADAPYWNIELTDDIGVAASTVRFAGSIRIDGDLEVIGTITETSSIRFKENITPLDPALDKVNQLEAVSYNKIGADDREIGLIAEEVAELFPEVVTYNEEGQPQGIQYQRLSVILLKAVQELTERVNKLENK